MQTTRTPSRGRGFTLWFTGLPCAGKSTLAAAVAVELQRRGCPVELLDADVLRASLCRGLTFTRADRDENVARVGWVCGALNRHGVVAVAAVISPFRDARARLRESIPGFVEVYVKAPLSVCIKRDVKGLYAKALSGEISNFTGIDAPYEEPFDPHIAIETDRFSVAECVRSILEWIEQADMLSATAACDPTT